MLLAAISGSLYGTVGLFFAFIAMVRLFERSVRSAAYEPAFQLLYQPVPAGQRLIFQNQIEGIPKASGTVITGAVILLFSTIHTFNLIHYSWVFILVLGLWIWVAFKMYDQYRNMLKTKLNELEAENQASADPVKELVMQSLTQVRAEEFDQVFDLLETVYPVQTEESIPEALKASGGSTRLKILQKIRENQIISVVPFLKEYSGTFQTEEESVALNQTIRELEDQSRYSFEKILALCHSTRTADRHQAACILGSLGKYNAYKLLISLMDDPDPQVRRAAIRSAGKARRTEFWPSMVENLTDRRFAISSRIGLQQIGDPVLTDLDRFFEKAGGGLYTKKQIISIFESIGGPRAIKFLRSKMFYHDKEVRMQVLVALSRLGYRASVHESTRIKNMIEETIENILWIQACLLDIGKASNANALQLALLDRLEEDKQSIFMLLSLLYDSKTISHVMEHIESKDTNAKVYAFEIGDMLITDELKQIVFPLFEDITMQERLQRLENKFLQERLDPVDRMFDILNRDVSKTNLWVKAKVIELLGEQQQTGRTEEIKTMLAACLSHPHGLIVELAARTLAGLDKTCFYEILGRLQKNNNPLLSGIREKLEITGEKKDLFLYEKVTALKSLDLFFDIPENILIELLVQHQDIEFVKERADGRPDRNAKKYFISDSGCFISLTDEFLYELIDSSDSFAKRYLTSINIKPQNEGL
ncbi:MAG: HEAT repeat domain-containing protein [Mangrovibacterium sp.]